LSERGLLWAVGLSRRQNVYPADVALIFPVAKAGKPRKYHIPDQPPVSAEALLAGGKWQKVSWRRGTKGRLTCLFAARRVRVADGHKHRMLDNRMQCMPGDEVWLVGERRSTGEQKYYVSNLPADASLKMLAATIKARWVCEQAHQQLKEELGLDHFEGRSWTGLHRHALMTMIAYAFLQSRRLKAAGRKKKSRGTAATTEHAGHQASHPRPLRTASTQAMPPLRETPRRRRRNQTAKVVLASYAGGLLEMANARLYESWGSLTEALKTGRNQNEAKESGDLFGALYADPDRLRGFLAAMSGVSLGAAQAIAAKFPWKDYKTFADIGAAQGMVAATLAGAHPHLSGAGYDLPEVKPVFEEFIAKRGVSDRVKFLAGNFFMDPLPAADVLIMGHILHDWDLPQKRMLLEKAHAALPKGGALIVYESIIDDERRENAFGLMMSLNMLIETTGGFDFTGADCQTWMREAGFLQTRVEPLTGLDSMVIAIK
jgi:hypothetical protein